MLLSACSSKDDATPGKWYLTKSVSYDLETGGSVSDTAINLFKWHDGKLSEITEIFWDIERPDNSDTSTARLTFTDGRLAKLTYADDADYLLEMVYKENRLSLVKEFSETNLRFDSVAYNEQGKVKEVYSGANEMYKVTWEGNNVKSYKRYSVFDGVATEAATKTFEYDSKSNYYPALFTDNCFWKMDPSNLEFISANNVTKETYTYVGSTEQEVTTYEYVYNGDNLLAEIKISQAGGYDAGKRIIKLVYTKQ
ncbi:hypothetical protein EGT74_01695 [Chitinophaga lutea]|uniref:DUF4595 domain-containing protein n=2 Tax=Chitinophaga lutea TaxID=2488634 RepID=A0A3N4Q8B1_9BACT|nr:hypothetical protein EGT74_01695 [Chitinophaga lutea]